jgi:hypothetical protein
MTRVLKDLSHAALTRAIEENRYAFTPFSHGWPDMASVFNRRWFKEIPCNNDYFWILRPT